MALRDFCIINTVWKPSDSLKGTNVKFLPCYLWCECQALQAHLALALNSAFFRGGAGGRVKVSAGV